MSESNLFLTMEENDMTTTNTAIETMQIQMTVKRGRNQVLRNTGNYITNYTSKSFACQSLSLNAAQEVSLGDIQAIVIKVNSGKVVVQSNLLEYEVANLVVLENLDNVQITAVEDSEVILQYTLK